MIDSVKLMSANNAYGAGKAMDVGLGANSVGGLTGQTQPNESAFSAMVTGSIDSAVSTIQAGETTAVKSLLNDATVTELATAVTDAELTLRTVVSVRDKIISAYQDIIKMPI